MKVLTDRDRLIKDKVVNGADTYSRDIEKFQLANWEWVLGKNDIISFCPLFSYLPDDGEYDTAVQYLHSYPYEKPVDRIRGIIKEIPFSYKRLIFVTAYDALRKELQENGFEAAFVPMSIDANHVKSYKIDVERKNRILWFGNVKQNKVGVHAMMKSICRERGYQMDSISMGRFNKKHKISQEDSWRLACEYKYGIAVGRCAQELNVLGVKTMIAGQRVGGLITDEEDFITQLSTNMNGRICTYDLDASTCLRDIDKSIHRYLDISTLNHAQMVVDQCK